MHLLFARFNTPLEGIFWDLFELRRRGHFDGIDVRKMGFLKNRCDLGEEEKATEGHIGGIWGGVPKLQCSFLQETDEYSGLCEQELYRDGASMHGLSKGSVSCHALFSRGAKECHYRRFGSLFGLGLGIQNE